MKTLKSLLISKLALSIILFCTATMPASSFSHINKTTYSSYKNINQETIIQYLISKGYTNISNVNPIQGTNNWLANARNPQGFNVLVRIYTDGWNIIGHEDIWIR